MSGMPEKELRTREYNRQQLGQRTPNKDIKHQSVDDFFNNGGTIRLFGPTCKAEHKRKPYLALSNQGIEVMDAN